MGIIDPAASKQVAAVAEGGVTGHEVIASPDGKTAYVPIYGDSGVGKPGTDGTHLVVVDLASRKAITGQRRFRPGRAPALPDVRTEGRPALRDDRARTTRSRVIDPKTLKIVGDGADRPARVAHAGDHAGRHARLHGQRGAGHGLGAGSRGAQDAHRDSDLEDDAAHLARRRTTRWRSPPTRSSRAWP